MRGGGDLPAQGQAIQLHQNLFKKDRHNLFVRT
jgi:hypothetical protein